MGGGGINFSVLGTPLQRGKEEDCHTSDCSSDRGRGRDERTTSFFPLTILPSLIAATAGCYNNNTSHWRHWEMLEVVFAGWQEGRG